MRVSLAQGHSVVAAVAAVLGPASEVEALGLSVTDFAVADWSGPFGIVLELHVASTVDAARVAVLLALAEGDPRISDDGALFWRRWSGWLSDTSQALRVPVLVTVTAADWIDSVSEAVA